MKMNKLISTLAIASLMASTLFADDNQTKTVTVTVPPVVGGTIIDVTVTEIFATGYRASKLLKADVYNKDGYKVGTIDDFIVGGGNGTVTFAVVSVGGFLGIGGRNIAVPAILFETNSKGQLVLPKATKEDLLALPEFKYAE